MDKDHYRILVDKINSIQHSIDILSSDGDHDSKKINKVEEELGEIRIKLTAVESQVDELRKIIKTMPQKTQDKVTEAVQPMIDSADALTEEIEKKKTSPFRSKNFNAWERLWVKKK